MGERDLVGKSGLASVKCSLLLGSPAKFRQLNLSYPTLGGLIGRGVNALQKILKRCDESGEVRYDCSHTVEGTIKLLELCAGAGWLHLTKCSDICWVEKPAISFNQPAAPADHRGMEQKLVSVEVEAEADTMFEQKLDRVQQIRNGRTVEQYIVQPLKKCGRQFTWNPGRECGLLVGDCIGGAVED